MAAEAVVLRSITWVQEMFLAMENLRKQDVFCDVTIRTEEGKAVNAHSVVLATASPFFLTVLSEHHSQHKERNVLVKLNNLPHKVIEHLINFVYSGTVTIPKSDLPLLHAAASSLGFSLLAQMVGSLLTDGKSEEAKSGKSPSKDTTSVEKDQAGPSAEETGISDKVNSSSTDATVQEEDQVSHDMGNTESADANVNKKLEAVRGMSIADIKKDVRFQPRVKLGSPSKKFLKQLLKAASSSITEDSEDSPLVIKEEPGSEADEQVSRKHIPAAPKQSAHKTAEQTVPSMSSELQEENGSDISGEPSEEEAAAKDDAKKGVDVAATDEDRGSIEGKVLPESFQLEADLVTSEECLGLLNTLEAAAEMAANKIVYKEDANGLIEGLVAETTNPLTDDASTVTLATPDVQDFTPRTPMARRIPKVLGKYDTKTFKPPRPRDVPHAAPKEPGPAYQCGDCGQTFADEIFLERHQVHHRKRAEPKKCHCSVCGFSTNYKNLLEDHMRIHTGEKPFTCTCCNRSFRSKGLLSKHIKQLQRGPRTWSCELCGATFTSYGGHKYHIRNVHLKERAYKCPYVNCGKTYHSKTGLDRHKWVHTGELKFKCQHCPKAYPRESSLVQHMHNRHLNMPFKYACDQCDKVYRTANTLRSHRRQVHDQKFLAAKEIKLIEKRQQRLALKAQKEREKAANKASVPIVVAPDPEIDTEEPQLKVQKVRKYNTKNAIPDPEPDIADEEGETSSENEEEGEVLCSDLDWDSDPEPFCEDKSMIAE